MELDRIATGEALRKRNIQVGDSLCRMCGSDEESVYHLFIACCKIPSIFAFSIKDPLDVHMTISGSEKKKMAVQGVIRIACWILWRARNNLLFSDKPVRIDSIVSEIKALGFL
ncbi:uncharacterized protein LOC110892365 [Helianthus annuus]|uniref:uncharacterized protein LOC110892365 n=1 Tax=Helianthus annuus TaxID=4232 RepID=UPI000B8F4C56|nr:uncharacterized protein LOC110892365 [Helianthus annuus]